MGEWGNLQLALRVSFSPEMFLARDGDSSSIFGLKCHPAEPLAKFRWMRYKDQSPFILQQGVFLICTREKS
jgi:hypothetical protein